MITSDDHLISIMMMKMEDDDRWSRSLADIPQVDDGCTSISPRDGRSHRLLFRIRIQILQQLLLHALPPSASSSITTSPLH